MQHWRRTNRPWLLTHTNFEMVMPFAQQQHACDHRSVNSVRLLQRFSWYQKEHWICVLGFSGRRAASSVSNFMFDRLITAS